MARSGIIFAGDVGDEKENGADSSPAAANGTLALPLSAVVGERGKTDELGDGLVGDGADLGEVGEDVGAQFQAMM